MACLHRVLYVIQIVRVPIVSVFEDGALVEDADHEISAPSMLDPVMFQVSCPACKKTWTSSSSPKAVPKKIAAAVDAARKWAKVDLVCERALERGIERHPEQAYVSDDWDDD